MNSIQEHNGSTITSLEESVAKVENRIRLADEPKPEQKFLRGTPGKQVARGEHTPGPWYVSPPTRENPSRARVTALSGGVNIYDAPLTRETEANAHLIAAAPDMLQAFEGCLSLIEFYAEREMSAPANNQEAVRDTRESLRLYRAAIAKAKGQFSGEGEATTQS